VHQTFQALSEASSLPGPALNHCSTSWPAFDVDHHASPVDSFLGSVLGRFPNRKLLWRDCAKDAQGP